MKRNGIDKKKYWVQVLLGNIHLNYKTISNS